MAMYVETLKTWACENKFYGLQEEGTYLRGGNFLGRLDGVATDGCYQWHSDSCERVHLLSGTGAQKLLDPGLHHVNKNGHILAISWFNSSLSQTFLEEIAYSYNHYLKQISIINFYGEGVMQGRSIAKLLKKRMVNFSTLHPCLGQKTKSLWLQNNLHLSAPEAPPPIPNLESVPLTMLWLLKLFVSSSSTAKLIFRSPNAAESSVVILLSSLEDPLLRASLLSPVVSVTSESVSLLLRPLLLWPAFLPRDLGKLGYTSRMNMVISLRSKHAIIFKAYGVPSPEGFSITEKQERKKCLVYEKWF